MPTDYLNPPQAFGSYGDRQQSVQGAILASAATLAPVFRISHVSGVAAVSNITVPWDDFSGGLIVLIADGLFSLATGGNILTAFQVEVVNTAILLDFDKVNAKWTILTTFNPSTTNGGGTSTLGARVARVRTTTAAVNAGATLLPAVAGLKWGLVDATIISVGGSAAGATAVTISGTQAASPAVLISAAVAALTQSTVVKPNTASVTVLADGASYVLNDVNTAITIAKTGGALTTSTNIDVILTMQLSS